MKATDNHNRYLVPGLVRGVEILKLFNRERQRITSTTITEELGIPRSTVFRLTYTLEHLGLIVRDASTDGYLLGAGMLELGLDYVSNLELHDVCREDLEQLRNQTGCATHLAVCHERDAVVVMKIAGRSAFAGSLNVGTRLPLHATVLGRCLLLDHDLSDLRRLFGARKLKRYTDQTPNEITSLHAVLQNDQRQSVIVSESFFERGISSIAAPVRDHTGSIVAAISITLYGEVTVEASLKQRVSSCAGRLSERLHYRDNDRVMA